MSTSDCPYCTGTFDLADDPGLGPCVCCTPAKMRELRDAVAIDNTVETERDEALAILGEAGDVLTKYLIDLGLSPRAVVLDNPHLDRLTDLLGD